jgi:LPS sulfotransferase NodH
MFGVGTWCPYGCTYRPVSCECRRTMFGAAVRIVEQVSLLCRMAVSCPARTYFVCATPRSGSTLLCRLLAATGVAGKPEEYFERLRHSGLPRQPREYFEGVADAALLDRLAPTRRGDPAAADLERELPRYLAEGTTPNGVFGAKLMWSYFGDLLARLGTAADGPALTTLRARFGPLEWIHVTRRDTVAQAVSLWRAVQTRAWSAADETGTVEPVYDARAIAHLHDQVIAQDAAWRGWFDANGVAPLTVAYEALAAEHAATLHRVLDHLGLEAEHVPDPPMDRQGDARSDRWVARFNDEKELV